MFIDHIGIAVSNLDEAIKQYQLMLNLEPQDRLRREDSGVELVFFDAGETSIELLAPIRNDSALTKFLAESKSGLHHICYRVNNLEAEMKRFASLGYELIDKTPRVGARSTMICFIYPKETDGVLIELCQEIS